MNDELKQHIWSHNETTEDPHRFVFLGASNLTRSFATVVSLSRTATRGPLSIYVAKGHGRSYGVESTFFGKKIPGIFYCGIWNALREHRGGTTSAWITDVGNDLAYEVPVEKIVHWVFGCVDRLLEVGAEVVLCDLPVDNLCRVGELRFRLMRSLLFPNCRLQLRELQRRAEQLSEQLHEGAIRRQIPFFTVSNAMYGIDPIHPRRAYLSSLWRDLFSAGGIQIADSPLLETPLLMRWYLTSLHPEAWSFFTVSRRAVQPNGKLHDGTSLALY